MNALLFAQTDSTGQKVTLIVFALVAVAAGLALLTAWYWRITDPALRNGEARGRGGRWIRRSPEPEPSTDPGASSAPRATRTDQPEQSADHTRLMNRSDILEQTEHTDASRPDVIDLRDPRADAEDPVLDVESVDHESIERDQRGREGAHDDGIDFDEWLALAEEES